VPAKPTSEEIRLEAENLRATAAKLIEHAKTLITKAAELEKRITARTNPTPPTKSAPTHPVNHK
jgi:hypothetical protein